MVRLFLPSLIIVFCNSNNSLLATNAAPRFSHRILPDSSDVCLVSLGGNCRNSTWLKELNLRFQAFPFDWVESEEIEGLIDLINNDFKDYLLFENLIPYSHSHYNRIRDKNYKINLVHEFSFQGTASFSFSQEKDFIRGMNCLKNEYNAIYTKYQKRINRFRDLTKNYKFIIFIRTLYVDKPSAINLYKALTKLFGNDNKIRLVAISDMEEFKNDWGFEKIKNFYLPTLYLINDGYGQYFGHIIETVLSSY